MVYVFGILIAILVFGIMIFLHEFGHYLAARLCKVKVLEFAVGMGPKLLSFTSKKTDIVYSLRALPIGGFTAMQGEDGEDPDPSALVNRPRWQRLIVLFAGSFMNIVSGILVMFIYLSMTGLVGTTVVADFQENSVSDRWLRPGDEIVSINGKNMLDYTDIANTIIIDGTSPLDMTVIRDGETVELNDVIFHVTVEEGVEVAVLDFRFQGIRPGFAALVKQTLTQSLATVKLIYRSLALLISGRYGFEGVSGPVGTVGVISKVATSSFSGLLYLFSFISLNLGVMNLLPIPALDGGRIFLLLWKWFAESP